MFTYALHEWACLDVQLSSASMVLVSAYAHQLNLSLRMPAGNDKSVDLFKFLINIHYLS